MGEEGWWGCGKAPPPEPLLGVVIHQSATRGHPRPAWRVWTGAVDHPLLRTQSYFCGSVGLQSRKQHPGLLKKAPSGLTGGQISRHLGGPPPPPHHFPAVGVLWEGRGYWERWGCWTQAYLALYSSTLPAWACHAVQGQRSQGITPCGCHAAISCKGLSQDCNLASPYFWALQHFYWSKSISMAE